MSNKPQPKMAFVDDASGTLSDTEDYSKPVAGSDVETGVGADSKDNVVDGSSDEPTFDRQKTTIVVIGAKGATVPKELRRTPCNYFGWQRVERAFRHPASRAFVGMRFESSVVVSATVAVTVTVTVAATVTVMQFGFL
jgi:hypothetical protein